MKKALILPVFVLLSACAQEGPIYKGYANQGCSYYDDSGNCLSRKASPRVDAAREPLAIAKPRRPVEYRYASYENITSNEPIVDCIPAAQVVQPAPAPLIVQQQVSQVTNTVPCNGCQPTIKEVREPVEITYKKTTYTTVYQPKTYEAVSFEKQALTGNTTVVQENVQLVETPVQATVTLPVQTTVTVPVQATVTVQAPTPVPAPLPVIEPITTVTTEILMPEDEIK